MGIDAKTDMKNVGLTEAAARRIKHIMAEEPGMIGLRVAVDGGGCSGFSYRIELTDTQNDDDTIIERDGAKLYVDELSLVYMAGSEVDFVDDLIGQSFQIKNPNAVASCGCGTSFSI